MLKVQNGKCALGYYNSKPVVAVSSRFHTQNGNEPPMKTYIYDLYNLFSGLVILVRGKASVADQS